MDIFYAICICFYCLMISFMFISLFFAVLALLKQKKNTLYSQEIYLDECRISSERARKK